MITFMLGYCIDYVKWPIDLSKCMLSNIQRNIARILINFLKYFLKCFQCLCRVYKVRCLFLCATFISCWFLSFGPRILFTFRAANHMQILLSRNDFVTRAHNKLICNGNK